MTAKKPMPQRTRRLAGRMLALGMLAIATECGGHAPASLDPRTAVQLTAEQRNAVLTEMRTMLGSVSGVLGAAARNDSAGIRGAAHASGAAAAADPALEKLLPEAWLQMAEQTHSGFDSLAAAGAKGRDTVIARLGRVTTNCVSCHAMYRLAVR
jgi:cytochrome c556